LTRSLFAPDDAGGTHGRKSEPSGFPGEEGPNSPGLLRVMAAFPEMLRRDRERWGFASAKLRLGVSVREYRQLEAGERWPDSVTWDRICTLYGGPRRSSGAPRDLGTRGWWRRG